MGGERRRSLQDSHQQVQLTEGAAVPATEPRLVLDEVADVFQLLVAKAALVEPAREWGGVGSKRPSLVRSPPVGFAQDSCPSHQPFMTFSSL